MLKKLDLAQKRWMKSLVEPWNPKICDNAKFFNFSRASMASQGNLGRFMGLDDEYNYN
jgi:hypothetical protein